MAMSDDIRSVRSFLGSLNMETFSPALVALACSNLDALAEQAEALENTPLAMRSPRRRQSASPVRRMEVLSLLQ
ncbi:hypothetical protein [Mailhella massiliensis]|uniref:Uncharacterized protein n=1 Tax=Mailhella massiliensis TaxID=1903261 RepID=A0A921AU66_9BACT|nr:hypothetical protein [Mailhella massiliensis]HJD96420.1 hypothetical protein [Mailhella massiliensis]